MASKIRIIWVSGSALEGMLTTAQAATFAYDELPTTIVVNQDGSKERSVNISQILEDDTIVDVSDTVKGYYIGKNVSGDDLWRDLVEELYGASGLVDYDALLAANDDSATGTVIYP